MSDIITEPISFSPEQVRALCGGFVPAYKGFDYDRHAIIWFLEDGVLEPYAGGSIDDILPAPGIRLMVKAELAADKPWW